MPTLFATLQESIIKCYTKAEFSQYPDYSWLIYNLTCFISPTRHFPKHPPPKGKNTYWSQLFHAYQKKSNLSTSEAMNEFKDPSSKLVAQAIFDLTPQTLQYKFYLFMEIEMPPTISTSQRHKE